MVDLDDDRIPDLLTTTRNDLLGLSGIGDGSFLPEVRLAANGPRTVADMNGDGIPDLVVAQGGDVVVLQGLGDGSFTEVARHDTGAFRVSFLSAADLDGDTVMDLAIRQRDNSLPGLAVLLGDGAGGFQQTDVGAEWPVQDWVGVGDVDGDDILDLVVLLNRADFADVGVWRGNGDGTFRGSFGSTAPGRWGSRATLIDLDGDGRVDLLGASTSYVHVMRGDEDGGFRALELYGVDGRAIRSVAAGDFDRDGATDLFAVTDLVAARSADGVSIMLNIPEPSSGAGGAAALGALMLLRRRRERSA